MLERAPGRHRAAALRGAGWAGTTALPEQPGDLSGNHPHWCPAGHRGDEPASG